MAKGKPRRVRKDSAPTKERAEKTPFSWLAARWSENWFHIRAATVISIAAVLVTIAFFVIEQLRPPQPIIVNVLAEPAGRIEGSSSTDCDSAPIAGIDACILGRTKDDWAPELEVGVTTVFDVQLEYQNVTDEVKEDVVVRVEIPEDLEYLDGTTFFSNANGLQSIDDGIAGGGVIIGSYLPSGNGFLKFAVVATYEQTLVCGENLRVINYKVTTNDGSKNTALPVTIFKDC